MAGDPPRDGDAPTEAEALPGTEGTAPLQNTGPPGPQLATGALLQARFRIVRMIARGGMGEVYEALDVVLGTRVALKTLRFERASDDRALQRFRREILLARKIGHPNVCRVFELHVGGPGEPALFLTMELLEGETLAERLRREGRLPESTATALVLQIAAALSAAHGEGVVHRDLKASNVMLVPLPGGDERAVVTDFGIAHALDAFSDSTATWDGPLGTPAYMAPEQVTGGAVAATTDLYCLGVLMYQLATGSLPFSGETPQAVAYRRLEVPAPDPRKAARGVSKRWSELTAWCLSKEPARRPQSAEALVRALRGRGRPIRQLRPLALLALLLALTAAVGLVVSRSRWVQRPQTFAAPRPVAIVLEAANLTGDNSLDWLSTALPEALTAALEPIRAVRLVPPRIVAERQFSLGTATAPSFPNWDEPRRLAESLGATFLVVLTFHRDQDSLRWEAQVHRAPSQTALASATELSPAEDVSSVADRLAAKLTTGMQWQKGESLLRSSLIPRRALPETSEARRYFVEGLRRYARYDRREARVLVKRTLHHEPGFLEALPLLFDIELEGKLGTSQDEAERGLKRLAVLPDSPERQLIEAAALNVLGRNDEAAERFAALLGPTPDDFELGLQRAWAAPAHIAYQQLAALRALPPPLGTDPRIDLCEAENRRIAMELPETLRAVDHGLVEARRRGDRMIVSALLEGRGSTLLRLGRIDEMAEAFLSAEGEALAAGAGAAARELRLGRAWRLDEAGRLKGASQLLRQLLAELPPLGEGWRTLRPELLLHLASVEDNLGHALVVRDLLHKLKAASDSPSLRVRVRRIELSETLATLGAPEREGLLRRELAECEADEGCRFQMGEVLAWELLAQGRPADAEQVLSTLGGFRHNARLYAHVMTDLGKAGEAYAELQPMMRADSQLRAEIGTRYVWQHYEALATCLVGMRELDQAAALVERLAPFHRASEALWIRSEGLTLESDLALARRILPPELPGLLQREIAPPGYQGRPRTRTALRLQLGRLLLIGGRPLEGRRLLTETIRDATRTGDVRIVRLAQAALARQ